MATLHAPACALLVHQTTEDPRDQCTCGACGVRPRRTMLDYIDECKRIAGRAANATELALTPYDNLPDEMQKALDAGDAERAAQAANMIRAVDEAAHPMRYVVGVDYGSVDRHWYGLAGVSADGPSQKLAAIEQLNADLEAGRVKIPENRFSFATELAQQGFLDADEARELLNTPQVTGLADYVPSTAPLELFDWFCASCEAGSKSSDPVGDALGRCQRCSTENKPTRHGYVMGMFRPEWRGDATGTQLSPYARAAEVRGHLKGLGWDVAWSDESTDPLDVEYDDVALRDLLIDDERARRYEGTHRRFTPAQRAAVSAHWSAELRARVDAAKAKERHRVVLDLDPEDL